MAGTAAGGGGAEKTGASDAAALNGSEALWGATEIGDLRACRRRTTSPRKNQDTNAITGHKGLNPTGSSTSVPYPLRSSRYGLIQQSTSSAKCMLHLSG